MVGLTLHVWENIMVGSLAATAVAAIFVGIATYAVVRLQRAELAASQHELGKYKQESNERIASADAKAAEANRLAAEASKETELAKLATEKLRLRLVWRLIDEDSQSRLTQAMMPFTPQPFVISTYVTDPEASNFAALIRGSLEKAGWSFRGLYRLEDVRTGLWLAWSNPESGRILAPVIVALEQALTEAGAPPNGHITGDQFLTREVGVLHIVIGAKRPSSIEMPFLEPNERSPK